MKFRSRSGSGDNKLQVAYFNDRVKDPALLGVGDIDTDTGDILPDVYSGTFSYNGGELQAQGVRFVFQRRLSERLTATVDYAYGGVLELEQPDVDWTVVRNSLQTWLAPLGGPQAERIRAALARRSGLRLIAGPAGQTLMPGRSVQRFGRTDRSVLQPVRPPAPAAFPRHAGDMEAIIDLRNLLAQGYVPVMGPDGQTVYLVQSARSVRGGLAFTF